MTQEEKGDKKWLDDDYYWNSFYTAHYHAGWRCVEQNNDDENIEDYDTRREKH